MKSKKEICEYAPWELESNEKKRPHKKGIPPSNQKASLHSKPKSKDHSHLEMYILAREKERLERYGSTLGRRVKSIASTWKEVKSRMYDLHKSSTKVDKEGIKELIKSEKAKKNAIKKKAEEYMQKIDWNY